MKVLPQKYADFKSKQYWNHFYSSFKNTQNEHFQWYGNYEDFKQIFHPKKDKFIEPKQHILHVGCGKSTFGEDLYKAYKNSEGYQLFITNCDYSEQMVNQMNSRLHKLQDIQLDQADKNNIKYQVCDLLTDFTQNEYKKYINRFDTIIDKGTLDAMLPEDKTQNINKIKQIYFKNLQYCLRQKNGKIVIISMLQQFVLRTIFQYFFQQNQYRKQHYNIQIHQCNIKNSTMQPFMVVLNKQQKLSENIKYLKFGTNIQNEINCKKQLMQIIDQTQKSHQFTQTIQKLIPGQRTRYKIFNQLQDNSVRYLIEIIDSESKQFLSKNNCAVYIVPQGSENSYHFDDSQGIKQLHQQIGASRLLLTKLMPGNTFSSIQQVKKQLNSVLPDLIQKNCDSAKVPYLMNADQLGTKNAVFTNQEVVIDEVIVNGQPYRRFFRKTNLGCVQSEFKLCYNGQNSIYAKFSKLSRSKILPAKKNMIVGIDKHQLADDTAQNIFSGILGYLGEHRLSKNCKILIIGQQIALAKYLIDNFEQAEVTLLTKLNKLKQITSIFMELPESERFQIIKIQDYHTFLKASQSKYDAIISADNSSECQANPSHEQFNQNFINLVKQKLNQPALFIIYYWNYKGTPNKTLLFKSLHPTFFPLFSYISNQNQDDTNVIFGLQFPICYNNGLTKVHEQLIKNKLSNSKNLKKDWQKQKFNELRVVWPNFMDPKHVQIDKQSVFEDVYSEKINKQKKNKKKKK